MFKYSINAKKILKINKKINKPQNKIGKKYSNSSNTPTGKDSWNGSIKNSQKVVKITNNKKINKFKTTNNKKTIKTIKIHCHFICNQAEIKQRANNREIYIEEIQIASNTQRNRNNS